MTGTKKKEMKFQFKTQKFQTEAVESVVRVFAGQPNSGMSKYRFDLGKREGQGVHDSQKYRQPILVFENEDERRRHLTELYHKANLQISEEDMEFIEAAYRNTDIKLSDEELLKNIQTLQKENNIKYSNNLVKELGTVSIDVEMETGTGKTYCYIKTMFELHKNYGWSKFIVVVPSIAIREGVKKSFEITQEHFMELYGLKARFFIYDSDNLHQLEEFSQSSGINVMIINMQAFNTKKNKRIIYDKRDHFNSRRPIDLIKANRPIIILDEPQKMQGAATQEALKKNFNPLFSINYSATHKKSHNLVYVLDALDAFKKKLVKKIEVKGFDVKNIGGSDCYLYLSSIDISPKKPPRARLELKVKRSNEIKRETYFFNVGDSLYIKSNNLEQYKNISIAEISPIRSLVTFSNGEELAVGEASGDISEDYIRRIQIRETIASHFEKEEALFTQGIKCLSLFFIDKVDKYRQYNKEGEAVLGDYGKIFEEEYEAALKNVLDDKNLSPDYAKYLRRINVQSTHCGYFSIDKKTGRSVDSKIKRGDSFSNDDSAYDLILKNKERLLSFEEDARFIFSHSALREGWDNPNVFQICALKHSNSDTTRRQEVGRGLRLCVNIEGERQDAEVLGEALVHSVNKLTVVANESYNKFIDGLQKDIEEALYERPRTLSIDYFERRSLYLPDGETFTFEAAEATAAYNYFVRNEYIDDNGKVTDVYRDASETGNFAPLPEKLAPVADSIHNLVQGIYAPSGLEGLMSNGHCAKVKENSINNDNWEKFKELWEQINKRYAYTVDFESAELIQKSIEAINKELFVPKPMYTRTTGEQEGEVFKTQATQTIILDRVAGNFVEYDLIGKIAEHTTLTRKTVAAILKGITREKLNLFAYNPEIFISKISDIINSQKAAVVIEHISYKISGEDPYSQDIFNTSRSSDEFKKAFTAKRSIQNYVFVDGSVKDSVEGKFASALDNADEVIVYAKLPKGPRGFYIPTPVGNYSPDWAISFKKGTVKHIFFIAETKGSMDSLQLRPIEQTKIFCAKKLFNELKLEESKVRYHEVDSYDTLLEVMGKIK
ncbi:MAG: DEAD/DEAH box helicase family protein [Treponema phagedenis]|uniref:type III restriction-modification system endonuclease n=1 Tax=Treponema phagedenis TaxID=162 RepID=UPI003133D786